MCLPDFKEFKQINKNSPLIGYRMWRNSIKDSLVLFSERQKYQWKNIEGPHEVLESNSGIYAYNNCNNFYYNYCNFYYNYCDLHYNYYNNNYNYNYNNNYNYNYNYNNNNNYNYNYLIGIINQWGNTAIHTIGQRSEFASIKTLFLIRETDAEGPKKFLDWIKLFNRRVEQIAEGYNANTITWQDFVEQKSN